MNDLAPVLQAAAAALESGTATGEAAALLDWLGCPQPAAPGPEELHRARLFRAAARFARLFRLEAKDSPGLAAFGAEVAPDLLAAMPGLPLMGVSGTGLAPLAAFEGCVGEGIEYLSAVRTTADDVRPAPAGPVAAPDWLARILPAGAAPRGWIAARQPDGGEAWLPAELCLRLPAAEHGVAPPWALSIGCAAGRTPEAATLHALLELVERDAAALWRRGGQRPRPLALEDPAVAEAAAVVGTLRRGRATRRAWLLDITTDLGIPVVAALSTRAARDGLCCGVAARPGLAAAARAALLEMAQMELALEVVAAKRAERGEAGLNAVDRRHLARAEGRRAEACPLLHPGRAPRAGGDLPGEALAAILDRLSAHGLAPLVLDLTRPAFGVPVVRVLCPGLEVEPSGIAGPRLAATMADSGAAIGSNRIPGIDFEVL